MTAVTRRSLRGWWRRIDLREAPAYLVFALTILGLAYTWFVSKHWLRGVIVIAIAMIVGGVLRAVLPTRQAGLLAVRSRGFDFICYVGLGAAILVLGIWLRSSAA
jgi:Protein of unknown function (DUF3017)